MALRTVSDWIRAVPRDGLLGTAFYWGQPFSSAQDPSADREQTALTPAWEGRSPSVVKGKPGDMSHPDQVQLMHMSLTAEALSDAET